VRARSKKETFSNVTCESVGPTCDDHGQHCDNGSGVVWRVPATAEPLRESVAGQCDDLAAWCTEMGGN
jgi:hypothetical protein